MHLQKEMPHLLHLGSLLYNWLILNLHQKMHFKEQNCICDPASEVGCWASRDIRSGLPVWEEKKLTDKKLVPLVF